MLPNKSLATPRPRPPAKVKRTPSLNFPPPPPYALHNDMLLDSPITVTTQLIGSPPPGVPSTTPELDEWMNEKSKEELSDLLLKADGLIKSRETELGLTSALCKNLYEDNVSLKTQHELLLARLPSRTITSPGASPPIASPSTSPPPLPTSPNCYSADLSQTPAESLPPNSPLATRHIRKISVTRSEISLLAEQNAELLDKLQKLEQESEKSDQAGKRKLRKLEQEIQVLRDELEKTQARRVELEEQAQSAFVLDDDEIQRRREERVRGRRESLARAPEPKNEVKDFAPTSELLRSSAVKTIAETSSITPSLNLSSTLELSPAEESQPSTPTLVSATSYFPPTPPHQSSRLDYAIISQLISKIRELEETNIQIKNEQAATAERLREARRESESLHRAYDCLAEEDEGLNVVVEEAPAFQSSLTPKSGNTIKFSSLRRKLDGNVQGLIEECSDDEFASGISKDMQSTQRSAASMHPSKFTVSQKSRKSVMGLFGEESRPITGPTAYSSFRASPGLRTPSPLPTELGDMSIWSTIATGGASPTSPDSPSLVLSPGSIGRKPLHSLGSELGSDFGDDDWDRSAGNHHLRTTSLYSIAGMTNPVDGSPAESSVRLPSPKSAPGVAANLSNAASQSDWEDMDDAAQSSIPHSATPKQDKGKGLQLVIEPPTPQQPSNAVNSSPSLPDSLGDRRLNRNYRLSQTVRARTNRWIEARYTDPTAAVARRRRPTRPPISHESRSSDASAIFTETFDTVVRQLSFSGTTTEDDDHNGEEKHTSDILHEGQPSPNTAAENSAVVATPKKDGFVGFILEVWLWLQFAIVVLVFLWVMARRGPKSILQEAETRRRQGAVAKR